MSRLPDPDQRRRRILFRATHRGTYENDILIGGFVTARLHGFGEAELDEIERVMDLPDPFLADWLTGRQPIPAEADCPMLRAMRQAALTPSKPSPSGRGLGEGEATSASPAGVGHRP